MVGFAVNEDNYSLIVNKLKASGKFDDESISIMFDILKGSGLCSFITVDKLGDIYDSIIDKFNNYIKGLIKECDEGVKTAERFNSENLAVKFIEKKEAFIFILGQASLMLNLFYTSSVSESGFVPNLKSSVKPLNLGDLSKSSNIAGVDARIHNKNNVSKFDTGTVDEWSVERVSSSEVDSFIEEFL